MAKLMRREDKERLYIGDLICVEGSKKRKEKSDMQLKNDKKEGKSRVNLKCFRLHSKIDLVICIAGLYRLCQLVELYSETKQGFAM